MSYSAITTTSHLMVTKSLGNMVLVGRCLCISPVRIHAHARKSVWLVTRNAGSYPIRWKQEDACFMSQMTQCSENLYFLNSFSKSGTNYYKIRE